MGLVKSPNFLGRLLVAGAAAGYALVGVVGHGLHGLVPCGDACGHDHHHGGAAGHHEHGHDHCHAAEASSHEHGPQLVAAGHDADECSLCALLAKVSAGYAAVDGGAATNGTLSFLRTGGAVCSPAEPTRLAAARGPPLAS